MAAVAIPSTVAGLVIDVAEEDNLGTATGIAGVVGDVALKKANAAEQVVGWGLKNFSRLGEIRDAIEIANDFGYGAEVP